MELYEKLRDRRKKLGTQEEVHKKLVKIFGKKAISLSTIRRVENGVISKFDSIQQLAFVLGIRLAKLFEDTEFEKITVVKKKDQINHLSKDGFYAKILSGFTSSFLVLKCSLDPKKSRKPPSPTDKSYEKWIYVLKGELICTIEKEDFELKQGDAVYFKSSLDHLLKNEGEKTCEFLTLHTPRHY